MASYQVNCIDKPKASSTHEQITHIGYYESLDRPRVVISVAEAIARIEVNSQAFYVSTERGKTYLTVVKPENGGKKHLQSLIDRAGIDNLLTLEEV
ncbi:DUF3892 domain-containing protein [Mucilaginibacter sp. P25]|uniref:DUF3892 domain-containing protein n=1 Tax=Mucilaginibacter gossypii TaxID=551996 RepID=A0A1G8KNX8_9SPHI|nr:MULTISPECIES: DUF3892 domain-containing protein [Mucilaginibacter]QTE40013.1 DUF3892 domain-containing protein [Mucilaginibacter gossypii]RAV50868.1 DUF3892 domain-containing protein [Mucilaginibacter rubeus]SDI45113.1 Protein of unknown function [Mucilaginibacter gossypii]